MLTVLGSPVTRIDFQGSVDEFRTQFCCDPDTMILDPIAARNVAKMLNTPVCTLAGSKLLGCTIWLGSVFELMRVKS